MKKILFIFATILMLTGCGAEQIDTGNRGVETSWGKIVSAEPITEGLYFYNLNYQSLYIVSGNIKILYIIKNWYVSINIYYINLE